MKFLHHADVVDTVEAGLCPAYVFIAAGGELLAVEVIGGVACAAEGGKGVLQHFANGFTVGNGGAFKIYAAAALQREGVDGDVLGIEGENFVKALAEALGIVGGQACDKVHIDCARENLAGEAVAFRNGGTAVAAADGGKHAVGHGLGIDADAVGSALADSLQLFPGDGIGTACLHGKFAAGGKVKGLIYGVHQRGELLCGESGGRSAADIDGNYSYAQLADQAACLLNFLQQRLNVGGDKLEGLFHTVAYEGAVSAAGGAERYADIEGNIVGIKALAEIFRHLGGFGAEQGAILGGEIFVADIGGGFGYAKARLTHEALSQLARADARQRAPGGICARGLAGGLKEGELDQLLSFALAQHFVCGQFALEGGFAHDLAAHIAQAGAGELFVAAQFTAGKGGAPLVGFDVNGALLGEHQEHYLLNCVFVVVAFENEFHQLSRARRT